MCENVLVLTSWKMENVSSSHKEKWYVDEFMFWFAVFLWGRFRVQLDEKLFYRILWLSCLSHIGSTIILVGYE